MTNPLNTTKTQMLGNFRHFFFTLFPTEVQDCITLISLLAATDAILS